MIKNKITVMGICILIFTIIFFSGCFEKEDSEREKENIGPIDIGNVYHTPNNPTATDNVTIFATIYNATGYKAAISMKIEGGMGMDTKTGGGVSIKNNNFQYSSGVIEAFYESNDKVNYLISIRDSQGDTVFESQQYSFYVQ